MGTYDTAQICLNGHVITAMANSYPQHKSDFCSECGEKTIANCLSCNSPIKGEYHVPNVIGFDGEYDVPKYCEKCGRIFPWTELKIKAAKDLIEVMEGINDSEKAQLTVGVDDLVKGGPQAIVAQTKFKRLISKTGAEVSKAFKDILVDVVSESVKKAIWGN